MRVHGAWWSVGLAALVVALLGPSAALAHPPGTTQRIRVSSQETVGDDFPVAAPSSADGQAVAFESEEALVPQDGGFPVDVFVQDEQPLPI